MSFNTNLKTSFNTIYYQNIPHEKGLDHTLDLLNEGYLFIDNRVKKFDSNLFVTRIMGKKTVCMSGAKAAKIFYDEDLFQRTGAAPVHIKNTLFGKQSIQGLDGKEHARRKELFLSILSEENTAPLLVLIEKNLSDSLQDWEKADTVNIYYEAKRILFESVCAWAEVPYNKSKEKELIEDFALMIYSFGRTGKLYRDGKQARKRTEGWISDLISNVREFDFTTSPSSPLSIISSYKDSTKTLLTPQVAAVELINVLRPIIAVATFISFSALALHEFPDCIKKLQDNTPDYLSMFCQEVRRYYPYSPFTGAKVKKDFIWNSCRFKKGTMAILDLYGINHSDTIWTEPAQFNPERFADQIDHKYGFIPQGGGDITKTHRCAGDMLTVDIMKVFVHFLIHNISYTVPKQNLKYPLNKIPTLPESGFIISQVKKI